jgi:hypothetical protein
VNNACKIVLLLRVLLDRITDSRIDVNRQRRWGRLRVIVNNSPIFGTGEKKNFLEFFFLLLQFQVGRIALESEHIKRGNEDLFLKLNFLKKIFWNFFFTVFGRSKNSSKKFFYYIYIFLEFLKNLK